MEHSRQRFSQRLFRRPRELLTRYLPTRRLTLVVALLAPLWLLSRWTDVTVVPIAAIAMVLFLVVIDLLFTPNARTVEVHRTLPPSVGVGDTIEGRYTILHHTRRTLKVALFDAIPRAVGEYTVTPRLFKIPARQSADAIIALTGRNRGVHEVGPIVLRVSGPLDLVQRALRYTPDDQITVMPSVAGARGHHLQALQRRTRVAGARALRLRGASASFGGLRDYVPGDDPRHVDWKATARRTRMTSKEFVVEQGQTLVIAIDAGRMMTQYAGDRPRFEYALSSALLLADVALAGGDRVGLIVFNDDVRAYVAPQRGAAARKEIRAALTTAAATLSEPDYAGAFKTLAARQRRRSMIVLFTDVVDPRSSGAVIAHTVHTAQRHVPLVVALSNDQLVRAAVPSPTASLDTLYDAVAAEELLLARADALERMRQRGVSVLDTPPRAMTAAVINRYLELKDRAAL